MEQKNVKIGAFEISNRKPFSLLCGPCQIESKQHAIDICGAMREITKELDIPYIFKASFDKANRSSINGARGIGLEKGMETFDEIKRLYDNIPVVTDVHEPWQCAEVAKHVDMLQIPAFLCRQTDLVVAAAKTGKVTWVCQVCGYVYDSQRGDKEGDVAPGTIFEDLLDSWICPLCGAPKTDFFPKEEL